jgi:hypothetical protein
MNTMKSWYRNLIWLMAFFGLMVISMQLHAQAVETYFTTLSWSADGNNLLVGTGGLHQIDSEFGRRYCTDGTNIASVMDAEGGAIFSTTGLCGITAMLLDGETLHIYDGFFRAWNVSTGELEYDSGYIDGLAIQAFKWNTSNTMSITTASFGVYTFEEPTRNQTSSFILFDLTDAFALQSIWSPDESRVATSTSSGSIYVWQTGQFRSPALTQFHAHTSAVDNLAWSAVNNLIVSGDEAGVLYVWNPTTGEMVRQLVGHSGAIYDLAWHPDGQRIVSASADGTLRVWDWQTGHGRIIPADGVVTALAFSPNGDRLAFGGRVDDPQAIAVQILPEAEVTVRGAVNALVTLARPTAGQSLMGRFVQGTRRVSDQTVPLTGNVSAGAAEFIDIPYGAYTLWVKHAQHLGVARALSAGESAVTVEDGLVTTVGSVTPLGGSVTLTVR